MMRPASADPVRERVLKPLRAFLDDRGASFMLAVSGGLDSMVLMDAMDRIARERIAAVATFDHRSGDHSRAAADFVRREGAARGLRVLVGRAPSAERSEAAWRAARWAFLMSKARETGTVVVTAHTADDQLETICMRVLRGSGARGLAGLRAPSPVLRPLLSLRRPELAAYAEATGVRYMDDPTNASVAYLRNRIRRDLLPAIAQVRPAFAEEMLRLAEAAAEVRVNLDVLASRIAVRGDAGGVAVRVDALQGVALEDMAALAPALAARAGVVLDRRGTTRLSQFILNSRTGARIQLSSGGEAVRTRGTVVIRVADQTVAKLEESALAESTVFGIWRFRGVTRDVADDAWSAVLPADRRLTVRGWKAGDRMHAAGSPAARRVKRYFSDAGIAGPERIGWPVVLADGEIVWIPGVRRSDAATDRSGRPVLRYRCERNDV